MSLLGDISDPTKDVAALRPLAHELLDKLIAALVPAIKDAPKVLEGLTITINVTRKPVDLTPPSG